MSVSDGQPVNAATVNAAFVSRTADSSTVGKFALQNSEPESGPFIGNPQRAINETFDVVGIAGLGDPNAKIYASTNVIADGMSRKEAIEALDANIGSIGTITTEYPVHNHDGVNTPQISASTLSDINPLNAQWQAETKTGVTGTFADISTEFALKNDGLTGSQLGVISLPPHNKSLLFDPVTGTGFEDVDGTKVFGRIVNTTGWELQFFTNKAGVETPYDFTVSTDIQFFYLEVFDLATRPTVPSTPDFFTLDVTADVVDASATQRGVVNTVAQTFSGDKTFEDNVIVNGTLEVSGLNVINYIESSVKQVQYTIDYTSVSTAAQTFNAILKGLDPSEMVHRVMIKPKVQWTGAAVVEFSVGVDSDQEKYCSKFNVVGAIVNDFYFTSQSFGVENFTALSTLKFYVNSDVNLDLLTGGSVDIYVWTSKGV